MGISYSTLREWKKKYSALSAALKKGREISDYIIENALFQRARGYTATVKKAIKVKKPYYDDEGRRIDEERVEIVEEEMHVPGDVTAQIFYLKNRKASNWKDKPDGDNFNDALQEMLKGLNQMNSIVTQPAPNRNIEDLE